MQPPEEPTGHDPNPTERSWLHRRVGAAGVLSFFAIFVLTGTAANLHRSRPAGGPVVQPIAFDHRLHVEGNQLECSTCHVFYEHEAFSGLPGREVCAQCHEEQQGESAEEAKLVQLLASGAALEWRPLFRQPAHVFYSHRRHVGAARLECEACHGDIGRSEAPPGRVRPLQMEDCIDCHRRAGVSTECTACHR